MTLPSACDPTGFSNTILAIDMCLYSLSHLLPGVMSPGLHHATPPEHSWWVVSFCGLDDQRYSWYVAGAVQKNTHRSFPVGDVLRVVGGSRQADTPRDHGTVSGFRLDHELACPVGRIQ